MGTSILETWSFQGFWNLLINYFLDIISLLSNFMQNVLILHSETQFRVQIQMKVNI